MNKERWSARQTCWGRPWIRDRREITDDHIEAGRKSVECQSVSSKAIAVLTWRVLRNVFVNRVARYRKLVPSFFEGPACRCERISLNFVYRFMGTKRHNKGRNEHRSKPIKISHSNQLNVKSFFRWGPLNKTQVREAMPGQTEAKRYLQAYLGDLIILRRKLKQFVVDHIEAD